MNIFVSKPVAAAVLILICFQASSQVKMITEKTLRDKIAGGWAGKMLGVTYGAPVEFRAQGITYDDPISWKPGDVPGSIWQDDLYVQLTFMMTMDKYGTMAPAKTFQEMFARSGYPLWHANVQARKNYFDGIYPPESGMPINNLHADDIDFQIEADYLGLMCPGMPNTASAMASRIGHIMNYGDGVYGGVFIAALYSFAYFEDDMMDIVSHALLSIPEESEYAAAIRDVIRLNRKYPDDWRQAWKELYDHWGGGHICEAGSSFNIDAKINGAFVVIGLLYGKGDPLKTMEISTRCGQDADCNPSSAMGVLGVMKGFSNLPDPYRQAVLSMADSTFINTSYTFRKVVEQTSRYVHELAGRNGSKISGDTLMISIQDPKPLALEVSFPVVTFDRKENVFDGKGWSMKGDWQEYRNSRDERQALFSGRPGSELSFSFEGSGVSITGNWLRTGGKADVYVDGIFSRTIDCYFYYAGQEHENMDIFHRLDLPGGRHTIRLVVKGERRTESNGNYVYITGATIFRSIEVPAE